MSKSIRIAICVIPLMIFLLLLLIFGRGLQQDPRLLQSTLIDQPVPVFDLPTATGKSHLLNSDLQGHASIVHVWATWCV